MAVLCRGNHSRAAQWAGGLGPQVQSLDYRGQRAKRVDCTTDAAKSGGIMGWVSFPSIAFADKGTSKASCSPSSSGAGPRPRLVGNVVAGPLMAGIHMASSFTVLTSGICCLTYYVGPRWRPKWNPRTWKILLCGHHCRMCMLWLSCFNTGCKLLWHA